MIATNDSRRRLRSRFSRTTVIVLVTVADFMAFGTASSQTPPEAQRPLTTQRLLEPGPQAQQLAREVGSWDVTMRLWPTAGAKPVVVGGLVAERTMMGLYLSETLRPAPGSGAPDFRRVDDLTYDSLQARWEYVSMDTRAPIGIMFARGFEGERGADAITVFFDNFANPGIGPGIGEMVRARHVDTRVDDNHTFKRQYWTRVGAPEWLAIEYAYTRQTGK
jgi:Protein of unknown function (DUF1579)